MASKERSGYINAQEVADLYRGHEILAHTVTHPFLEQSELLGSEKSVWKASIQEFSQAYAHDYANSRIEISPKFFALTKDGHVTLIFHFWSREIVNYTIAKEGTNVDCTPIPA